MRTPPSLNTMFWECWLWSLTSPVILGKQVIWHLCIYLFLGTFKYKHCLHLYFKVSRCYQINPYRLGNDYLVFLLPSGLLMKFTLPLSDVSYHSSVWERLVLCRLVWTVITLSSLRKILAILSYHWNSMLRSCGCLQIRISSYYS